MGFDVTEKTITTCSSIGKNDVIHSYCTSEKRPRSCNGWVESAMVASERKPFTVLQNVEIKIIMTATCDYNLVFAIPDYASLWIPAIPSVFTVVEHII